jgi:hypothetical protein
MKDLGLKLKLAVEAVDERDLISHEHRNYYGEGFLAGFDKAMELAEQRYGELKDEAPTKSPSTGPKIIIRRRPVTTS